MNRVIDLPEYKTMNHEAITAIVTDNGKVPYGVGVTPNPYVPQQKEWQRRHEHKAVLRTIQDKIESLFEPRFVTPPETSELIAAIVTASDARRVLEVGTHTGFTSLHILKAIYGKENAKLISIDARPAHDKAYWATFPGILEFVEGWTPQIFEHISGPFDLVFVDSDHSVNHTSKEIGGLWRLTRPGSIFVFHDVPEWQTPTNRVAPPVRDYLFQKIVDGTFSGLCIQTCEQLDCLAEWGNGYPNQCSPGLGIFIRR